MKSLLRFLAFFAVVVLVFVVGMSWRGGFSRSAPPAAPFPPSGILEAEDRAFTGLVAGALPSVVSIDALPPDAVNPSLRALKFFLYGRQGSPPPQLGSGVIVSKEGHVVTNYHVIEGAGAVRIHLNDGRTLPARYMGGDRRSDIAVLKIEGADLQPVRWGDSDRVLIGQRVFAVGNPLGLQETVTQGIISGKGRRSLSEAANEFFQTDAAINRGNSGGPLLDMRGELIGITSMITEGSDGIAFAIPSNVVRQIYEGIRDRGRFIRPWFGAVMRSLTPEMAAQLGASSPRGALLVGTVEGSPAASVGLEPGDIVTAFNGRPIVDHIDLRNRIAERAIGDKITLDVLRRGKPVSVSAVIAAEPSDGEAVDGPPFR